MAFGRVLVAVTVGAHQHVVLGGEGPVDERAAAFGAEETLAVPVALPVRQILVQAEEEEDERGELEEPGPHGHHHRDST